MEIGLIGAGNMAGALARGWGEPVLVHDLLRPRAEALVAELGGEVVESNAELARRADVVVLCHKPQQLHEVAEQISARAIASILAATTTAQIEEAYPDTPVYRFIPNIPAEVGRGVLCYAPGRRAADGPEDEVLALFGRAGSVVQVDEPLIEPATAIMSCGPAFLALVVEALASAGARHGLEEEEARRLVVQTMAGSAAYLEHNGLDPAELKRRVATPGGLTEKGLEVLEEGGIRRVFDDAVDLVVEATTE